MKRFVIQERGPSQFVIVDTMRLDAWGYYIVLPALCIARRMAQQLAAQYERDASATRAA